MLHVNCTLAGLWRQKCVCSLQHRRGKKKKKKKYWKEDTGRKTEYLHFDYKMVFLFQLLYHPTGWRQSDSMRQKTGAHGSWQIKGSPPKLTFVPPSLTSTRSILFWDFYVPSSFCGMNYVCCLHFFFWTSAWMQWKGGISLTHNSQSSSPHPPSRWVGRLAFVMCERFISSSLTEGAGAVMTTAEMNMWTILLLFILQAFCQLWKSPVLRWLMKECQAVIRSHSAPCATSLWFILPINAVCADELPGGT